MAELTLKQKSAIVIQQDLGLQGMPTPAKGANLDQLANAVTASGTHRSMLGSVNNPYPCVTQQSITVPTKTNSTHRLWLGWGTEIPRWVKGSTINYTVSDSGWPSLAHAQLVCNTLFQAAEMWNSYDIGVRFRWVQNLADCAYVAVYGGALGTTYARAVPPNSNDYSPITVFDFAFSPSERHIMTHVFLHELGHVLGLRHEFAAIEPLTAIQFGVANPMSVMSYNIPPNIQPSDVESARAFYNWSGPIGRYQVRDYYPDN